MENFRHLGGLPHEWEVAQGTIAERTSATGRSAMDFRAKQGLGDVASGSQAWVRVSSLGRETMQLVMAHEDPLKDKAVVEEEQLSDEEEAAPVDPSDPTADINSILDADYDTSTWAIHEIESACNTLLMECEFTQVLRRRLLSTRMILRLIDRHPEAKRFVEVAFETIVNRGIPTMSYGINARTFNIAHLLAAIAPRLAEKLSALNAVPRIAKMLGREVELAALMIQNRVRLKKQRQAERALEVRLLLCLYHRLRLLLFRLFLLLFHFFNVFLKQEEKNHAVV